MDISALEQLIANLRATGAEARANDIEKQYRDQLEVDDKSMLFRPRWTDRNTILTEYKFHVGEVASVSRFTPLTKDAVEGVPNIKATISARGPRPKPHTATPVPEAEDGSITGPQYMCAASETIISRPELADVSAKQVGYMIKTFRQMEQKAKDEQAAEERIAGELITPNKLFSRKECNAVASYISKNTQQNPEIGESLQDISDGGSYFSAYFMHHFLGYLAKEHEPSQERMKVLPSSFFDRVLASEGDIVSMTEQEHGMSEGSFTHCRYVLIPTREHDEWCLFLIDVERSELHCFHAIPVTPRMCQAVGQWVEGISGENIRWIYHQVPWTEHISNTGTTTCLNLVSWIYHNKVQASSIGQSISQVVAINNWLLLAMSHGQVKKFAERLNAFVQKVDDFGKWAKEGTNNAEAATTEHSGGEE